MRFIVITLLCSLVYSVNSFGQDEMPILLTNPSFEDFPRAGNPPSGWTTYGFPTESPPDTQPGGFGVTTPPFDGHSYLGLVVRENESYESVSQRLNGLILKGSCYEFSIYIARSLIYLSPTRNDSVEVNHVAPARLRIWGGSGLGGKQELLAETSVIINSRWLQYNFKFEPRLTHTYITFEAFYKTPVLFPYNGNILLDHASPIIPVPCDTELPEGEEPIASVEPTPEPDEPINSPVIPTPPSTNQIQEKPTPTPPKILKDLDRRSLQKGQTIRIDKLFFAANQSDFAEDSYEVLDEIYDFMKGNKDVIVEIGGHTNTIPEHDFCDRLSGDRAKAVVDYLIQKGIAENRLEPKGYGKRKPLFYDKFDKAARKKNQRVEIKILEING